MEDDTHLTLFSHQSKEYIPENAAGKFTSRVHAPVELEGAWDVGLTELHLTRFPRKPILLTQDKIFLAFLTLPKDMELLDPMKKAIGQYLQTYYNRNGLLVEELDQLFKAAIGQEGQLSSNPLWKSDERAAIWFATISPGKYLSMESIFHELTTQMNTLFNWEGSGSYATNKELSIAFNVNRASQKITLEAPGFKAINIISFNETILPNIGIQSKPVNLNGDIFHFKGKELQCADLFDGQIIEPPKRKSLLPLHVMCDIIKFQPCGQSLNQLLAIIPIPPDEEAEGRQYFSFEFPTYLPIMKHTFQNITIRICDENAEPCEFDEEDKAVLRLHFKRRAITI